jgi:hypothetical protein
MATLTKTLKLPFLRLNKAKAQEFARLERLNTEVANQILAMPKAERRKLTSGRAGSPVLQCGEESLLSNFSCHMTI